MKNYRSAPKLAPIKKVNSQSPQAATMSAGSVGGNKTKFKIKKLKKNTHLRDNFQHVGLDTLTDADREGKQRAQYISLMPQSRSKPNLPKLNHPTSLTPQNLDSGIKFQSGLRLPAYLQMPGQIKQAQLRSSSAPGSNETIQTKNYNNKVSASPSSFIPPRIEIGPRQIDQSEIISAIPIELEQQENTQDQQVSVFKSVMGSFHNKKSSSESKSLSSKNSKKLTKNFQSPSRNLSNIQKRNSNKSLVKKKTKKRRDTESIDSESEESQQVKHPPSSKRGSTSRRRPPQRDASRSVLNLRDIHCAKMLSECKHSLEFIIVAFCKSFNFPTATSAARFIAGGLNSQYAQCLKDIGNFSKINSFLSLLQTNLKTLIHILESENDYKNVKYGYTIQSPQENSSYIKIMNLLSMSLSRSVDERIVWQTCNLLSGIFQNVNGIQINFGFQTLMIRWAMNQDDKGQFKGVQNNLSGENVDFIYSCLIAKKNHSELNNVVIGLFYEVANMGRSKRKWERQTDISQLVELFATILPFYFEDDKQNEYFDLMHDILDSHHFQFEKERIDKQHLLFQMVDKCLYHLSFINGFETTIANDDLRKTLNIRQSCMSLICSIWSNNQQIFRFSLNKFIAHFVQLFKPDDQSVTQTLMFDYIEYQQQTKVGKIVLLLLKRNLKDSNKLIKITTYSQLFKLLNLFTKREEVDLINIVFKLLVFQLYDQFQKCTSQDSLEVREYLSNYLANYINQTEKANVGLIVEMIAKYAKNQLQNNQEQDQFPMFNLCDYSLLQQIIKHPKTNIQVAQTLCDIFTQIIFNEKFYDMCTLAFVQNGMTKLSTKFQGQLNQNLKKLIQYGCMIIKKLDLQILYFQQERNKSRKKKGFNELTYKQMLQQEESEELLQVLSNMIIKRHTVYRLIFNILRNQKKDVSIESDLKSFTEDIINRLSQKNSMSKTLNQLKKDILIENFSDSIIAHSSMLILGQKTLAHEAKDSNREAGASHTKTMKFTSNNVTTRNDKSSDRQAIVNNKENNHFGLLKLAPIKGGDTQSAYKRLEHVNHQDTYRTGGGAVKSTNRLRQKEQFDMQQELEEDFEDQSSQTTLRTEIYTSEDEEEMMNYYTYLSTYKKQSLKQNKEDAKSDNDREEQLHEKDVEPITVIENIPEQFIEEKQVNETNNQGIMSSRTKKGEFKRSNSLSQFHSSIKIMEEASNYLARTKEQLARPDELEKKNSSLAKNLGKKKKRRRPLMKRQSTHNIIPNREAETNSKKVSFNELPNQGGQTERHMFKNKLKLKIEYNTQQEENQSEVQLNQTIPKDSTIGSNITNEKKAKILRVDPNSNYQIKQKYISHDPIMEESLEQSKQKQIKENNIDILPPIKERQENSLRKNSMDLENMIHPTDDPRVMIIGSHRKLSQRSLQKEEPKQREVTPEQKKNIQKAQQLPINNQQKKVKLLIPKKKDLSPPPPIEQAKKDLPLMIDSPTQNENQNKAPVQKQISEIHKIKEADSVVVSAPAVVKVVQQQPLGTKPPMSTRPQLNDQKLEKIDHKIVTHRPQQLSQTKQNSILDSVNDRATISNTMNAQGLDSIRVSDQPQSKDEQKQNEQVSLPIQIQVKEESPDPEPSTPVMVNQQIRKIFEKNDEEEKEKNRTIYREQMISLGLADNKDDNIFPLDIQPRETSPTQDNPEQSPGEKSQIKIPIVNSPISNTPDESVSISAVNDKKRRQSLISNQAKQQQYQSYYAQMQQLQQFQMNIQAQLQQLQMCHPQLMSQNNNIAPLNFQNMQSHTPKTKSMSSYQKRKMLGKSMSAHIIVPPKTKDELNSHRSNISNMSKSVVMQMKLQASKELDETLKSIRLNADQIDTISQKASERVRELQNRRKKKLFQIRTQSMQQYSETGFISSRIGDGANDVNKTKRSSMLLPNKPQMVQDQPIIQIPKTLPPQQEPQYNQQMIPQIPQMPYQPMMMQPYGFGGFMPPQGQYVNQQFQYPQTNNNQHQQFQNQMAQQQLYPNQPMFMQFQMPPFFQQPGQLVQNQFQQNQFQNQTNMPQPSPFPYMPSRNQN